MIEVGCGDGRISKFINPDLCIEIDEEFKARLKKYNLVISDASYLPALRGEIVASLPYYITRDFMHQLSELDVGKATLILQKDFIDKILNYTNSISLILNYYFMVERKEVIPPNAFSPVPKVYSVIVLFNRQRRYDENISNILECIGNYRNKTLRRAASLCNLESQSEIHVGEFKPWQVRQLLSLIKSKYA